MACILANEIMLNCSAFLINVTVNVSITNCNLLMRCSVIYRNLLHILRKVTLCDLMGAIIEQYNVVLTSLLGIITFLYRLQHHSMLLVCWLL